MYLLIIFIFCICVFVTQVSGDIQTPEMAVTDSIIKVQVLKSGFHFIGGGVRPTAWVDKSTAQFLYAPLS